MDPVGLEVLGNRLLSIAEEMGVALVRTAYSLNIKERRDCSAALFDAGGELIAQAAHIPMHLSSLLGLVREVLARFPSEGIEPGDIFVANDPYLGGGSHLNDVAMVAPAFHGGRRVAFAATIAHHADVGGRFPGSESAECATLFQEGLRLPAVKLYAAGALVSGLRDIICLNSRTPREREGDLRAQVAACRLGLARIDELIARWGKSGLTGGVQALLAAGERRARGAISRLPPGTYEAEDCLDDEGRFPEPPRIRVRVTVEAGRLVASFAGTSPQLPWGRNAPHLALLATVYYAAKAVLDPDLPVNGGALRPIVVEAPAGCLVHATPPAAVGARFVTCQKVVDVLLQAFGRAVPGRVIAGCHGGTMVVLSGRDDRTGGQLVDYEVYAGGLGAHQLGDGASGWQAHLTNTSNLPIEALEGEFPFLVERYEFIPDSGGAGRNRGGLGVRREVRILRGEVEASGWSCNQVIPPRGLQGGSAGRPGGFFVRRANGTEEHAGRAILRGLLLRPGDLLRIDTVGGGGWGPPGERSPDRLRSDLAEGRVTPEGAARDCPFG
jgi:N-methylhydantoinase B